MENSERSKLDGDSEVGFISLSAATAGHIF